MWSAAMDAKLPYVRKVRKLNNRVSPIMILLLVFEALVHLAVLTVWKVSKARTAG